MRLDRGLGDLRHRVDGAVPEVGHLLGMPERPARVRPSRGVARVRAGRRVPSGDGRSHRPIVDLSGEPAVALAPEPPVPASRRHPDLDRGCPSPRSASPSRRPGRTRATPCRRTGSPTIHGFRLGGGVKAPAGTPSAETTFASGSASCARPVHASGGDDACCPWAPPAGRTATITVAKTWRMLSSLGRSDRSPRPHVRSGPDPRAISCAWMAW